MKISLSEYQFEDSEDEPNGDYEGTAARKLYSDRSDTKITPEFVSIIQVVIITDFS